MQFFGQEKMQPVDIACCSVVPVGGGCRGSALSSVPQTPLECQACNARGARQLGLDITTCRICKTKRLCSYHSTSGIVKTCIEVRPTCRRGILQGGWAAGAALWQSPLHRLQQRPFPAAAVHKQSTAPATEGQGPNAIISCGLRSDQPASKNQLYTQLLRFGLKAMRGSESRAAL